MSTESSQESLASVLKTHSTKNRAIIANASALLNKSRNTSEFQSVLSLTAFMFPVHSSQQAEAKDTGYFKTTSTNTTTTGKHTEYTTARQV